MRLAAAGGVLWRAVGDAIEVAVVHRQRYDDWSLPKGKTRRGESALVAAVREVREETGARCHIAGQLGSARYRVGSAMKTVTYFDLPYLDGEFTPNDEVDALRWCTPQQAASLLAYASDQGVLADFLARPRPNAVLALVRHARAGKRSEWTGPDVDRPLSARGRRQATALGAILATLRPDALHAANLVRCRQTLIPLAKRTGLMVQAQDWASDACAARDLSAVLTQLRLLAEHKGTYVVCSQGDAIPAILAELAAAMPANTARSDYADYLTRKGGFWLVGLRDGQPLFTQPFAPPAD